MADFAEYLMETAVEDCVRPLEVGDAGDQSPRPPGNSPAERSAQAGVQKAIPCQYYRDVTGFSLSELSANAPDETNVDLNQPDFPGRAWRSAARLGAERARFGFSTLAET